MHFWHLEGFEYPSIQSEQTLHHYRLQYQDIPNNCYEQSLFMDYLVVGSQFQISIYLPCWGRAIFSLVPKIGKQSGIPPRIALLPSRLACLLYNESVKIP